MVVKSDKYVDKAVALVRCTPGIYLEPQLFQTRIARAVLTGHGCLCYLSCRSQCVSSDYTAREAYDAVPQLHARGDRAIQKDSAARTGAAQAD